MGLCTSILQLHEDALLMFIKVTPGRTAYEAFVCFCNFLNKSVFYVFYSLNIRMMQAYYATYNDLFKYNLPKLHRHFHSCGLTPDLYLLDWIYTLFSKCPCQSIGNPMKRYWNTTISKFLTKLPDNMDADKLFKSIAQMSVSIYRKSYETILEHHKNVFEWKTSSSSDLDLASPGRPPSKTSSSSSGLFKWNLFSRHFEPPCMADNSDGLSVHSNSSTLSNHSIPRDTSHETLTISSTALIPHDRPKELPAKSEEERLKHEKEYLKMLENIKKKEEQESKMKKKQLELQLKNEEQQANAVKIWTQEILPHWESMRGSRKARDLWWKGLPPCVRSKVWYLSIGNELGITRQIYDQCMKDAEARSQVNYSPGEELVLSHKEYIFSILDELSHTKLIKSMQEYIFSILDELSHTKLIKSMQYAVNTINNQMLYDNTITQIRLDISRTFPHLCLFQNEGPYYNTLHYMLASYVSYNTRISYVQGMSYICALFILNISTAYEAFVCFCNFLNKSVFYVFYSLNIRMMQAYYATYNDLFKYNLPKLHRHFHSCGLTPDLYLLDWIYTLFSKAMGLDLVCKIWDLVMRDGEVFIFRAALGILQLHEDALLEMDFLQGSKFLTKLPDNMDADKLFKSIAQMSVSIYRKSYETILEHHKSYV
ncbi:TBC1 domain family member 12-like [Diaphorina citri]|uniref:TBC1 domain family member 12-like n=1 Tax=Diaphorina citri TaxID=121845 RepID=A0A1S3DEI0_DIACI|nr:TBC1 domain family member 12-like [Diaphorina citri]